MSKKLIFILFILLNVYFVYSETINVPSNAIVSGCGDGICNGNETCGNCKMDCGECFGPSANPGGGGGGGGGGSFVPGKPIEIPKEIKIPKCDEYWICDNWNECTNNEQNRFCYDLEKCNTTLYKPEEKRECIQKELLKPPEVKNYDLGLIFILILILIIYLLSRKKSRRKRGK